MGSPIEFKTGNADHAEITESAEKRNILSMILRVFPYFRVISVLLFFISCFAPLIANAQTGVITGRVVSEDGGGLANMPVNLSSVGSNRREASNYYSDHVTTDKTGNFKFVGLEPRLYSINVSPINGYVTFPVPASEGRDRRNYRIGDYITFTLVKGGVITGRVTTSTGETMIGVAVFALMVRDFEGNPVRMVSVGRQRLTDDRGVYRYHGLTPGTYVIYTRGKTSGSPISAYDGYAPTYHPSSPRETAVQIRVTSGVETTGVDIRYRGERGYTVSGAAICPAPTLPNGWTTVLLYNVSTGLQAGSGGVGLADGPNPFTIFGVPDGEYEIFIRGGRPNPDDYLLASRRITVRGADVGGIELRLEPPATVSGKIVVEVSPNVCGSEHKSLFEDLTVLARREAPGPPALSQLWPTQYASWVNDKGEFTIKSLDPSRYFIIARSQDENWYAKSITGPASLDTEDSVRPVTAIDVGSNGAVLKSGDRMTGLVVTIANGAASLQGRLAPENEGSRLPARMTVHLVPAEPASADDVLRYAEMVAGKDSAFEFKNLAPGKYWLVARAAPDNAPTDRFPTPAARDANERVKLRREAMAAKNEIELQPCGRLKDYVLRANR